MAVSCGLEYGNLTVRSSNILTYCHRFYLLSALRVLDLFVQMKHQKEPSASFEFKAVAGDCASFSFASYQCK